MLGNVLVTLSAFPPLHTHYKIQSVNGTILKKMSLLRYFPRKRKAEHAGQENDVHSQLTQDGLAIDQHYTLYTFNILLTVTTALLAAPLVSPSGIALRKFLCLLPPSSQQRNEISALGTILEV